MDLLAWSPSTKIVHSVGCLYDCIILDESRSSKISRHVLSKLKLEDRDSQPVNASCSGVPA